MDITQRNEKTEQFGLAGYGYFIVLMSFTFFYYSQRYVKLYCTPAWIDDHERWKWKNIFLSWIHAIIIGIWVLSCFYFYPEMKDDLIGHKNLFTYTAVSFSTGYFLSDSFDLVTTGQAWTNLPIAVHHIVVLWIFFYNTTHCTYIGYTIVALLVELNSVFLHLRKLMRVAKVVEENWIYRINAVFTVLTIVTFRFTALAWISYGIVMSYNRLPPLYLWPLAGSIGVMWIIYIVAFFHLLYADFLKKANKGKSLGKKKSECFGPEKFVSNNNKKSIFRFILD